MSCVHLLDRMEAILLQVFSVISFSLQPLMKVKNEIFYLWPSVGPQRFNCWNILSFRYITKFSMCVNQHFHVFVDGLSPQGAGGNFCSQVRDLYNEGRVWTAEKADAC